MTKQDLIRDDGMGMYFTIMLNMADDDLDPYQYRLLAHFKRVCGREGKCFQGTRGIAKVCQMSVGKVVSTRRELEQMGYITIAERPDSTLLITVVDRMRENVERYSGCSPHEQGVHGVNGGVHGVNQRITLEEEPLNKISAPDGAGGDKKAKKPREKNPLFDAVAMQVFNIAPDNIGGDGGRIGIISSWLAGYEPKGKYADLGAIKAPASEQHIKMFVTWWRNKYPNATMPRDLIKFVEYWRQWASEENARAAKSKQRPAAIQAAAPAAIDPAQMTTEDRQRFLAELLGS